MKKYSELRSPEDRIDLAAKAPLPGPLTVHIEPTNVCNFRCTMCPTGQADYQSQAGYYEHMPMELYTKILMDLKEFPAPVKSLKLYLLGEPLLNKNLAAMIKLARGERVAERIEVTSNGSMLAPLIALQLIESRLDYLRISVYSIDRARSREITGTTFDPEEILKNVARLKTYRDDCGSTTPYICAEMLSDTPERNRAFLAAYQPITDEARITQAHNWNGFQDRQFITDISIHGFMFPTPEARGFLRASRGGCPFPFYTLAVRADGRVVVCCVDWSGGTEVGNVKNQSLLDIWQGPKLKELQMLHLAGRRGENPSCAGCTAFYSSPDRIDHLSTQEFQRRCDTAEKQS